MKRLITILSLSALCVSAFAELHIVQKKDKYGYADESGKVVIKESYKVAMPFADGMAKVQKGDKWGYINESGKEVIKAEYDNIGEFDSNGIALVKKGGKYGYIRQNGDIVIKPDFAFIGSFNDEGYVWVAKGGKTLEDCKKGLYKYDRLILKPDFRMLGFYQVTDSADYSSGAYFGSSNANEIRGNLDKLSTSTLPYIWVDKAFKRGIYDTDGNELVKPVLYAMGAPVENKALMVQFNKKGNKYNYACLDKDGKKLFKNDIQKQITETSLTHGCYPFSGGLALVCPDEYSAYLINHNGYAASSTFSSISLVNNQGYIVEKDGKYGFLGTNGNEQIAPKYSLIKGHNNASNNILTAKDPVSGKFGFISVEGNEVIPFEYDNAAYFIHGRGYVVRNGKWGVINSNNKMIIQPRWSDVMMSKNADDSALWVKSPDNNKWCCLDLATDKLAFNDYYDSTHPFDSDGLSTVGSDGKFAIVNTSGEKIVPIMFDSEDLCRKAYTWMLSIGKSKLEDIDAYRFNIYNHPDLHKYRLHQKVDNSMWDY